MSLTTYANLKTAIETWSKRQDVSTYIDDFIDLAESEIWRYLRIRDMEARATASTGADRFLALPDSFIEMRRLKLISGSQHYDVEFSTPEGMQNVSGSGIPKFFTVTTQLEFDRTPTAYTVEMQYYKSLTALSSSNTTNAVLTRFPSIYLYGALWFLQDWALNPEKSQYYQGLFMQAIASANKQDKAGRYGAAPRMRKEGPTP